MSTPVTYKNDRVTTVRASFTTASQTTGITLEPLKDNNGNAISWGITGAQLLRFSRKIRNRKVKEYIYVPSASIDGTTFVVTLGTAERDVGDDFTGDGNPVKWPSGTTVELVWAAQQANQTAFKDTANTFSAKQTFSVPFGGPIYATFGDLPAGGNGDQGAYVTADAKVYDFIGGTWVARGNTGVGAATTTTLGTAEKGTTADIRAETSTGDAGGPIFIPADATAVLKDDRVVFKDATEKTIASGAITVEQTYHNVDTEGDAASDDLDTINTAVGTGECIILVANNTNRTVVVKHNTGNIKLADGADFSLDDTEKSITLLKQSGNWIEIARGRGSTAVTQDVDVKTIATSDSASVGASSTAEANMATNYAIGAGDLTAGATYHLIAAVGAKMNSGTLTLRVKIGSTAVADFGAITTTGSRTYLIDVFITCRSTGASGTVYAFGEINVGIGVYRETLNNISGAPAASTSTINTTISNNLQISAQYSASDSGHAAFVAGFVPMKLTA